MLELFVVFFKIGLFTFGGGLAMISIVEDQCVNKHKWLTNKEMDELVIVAESTPGPIAINCATYTGYKTKGLLGAIVATLAISLPSFLIIYLISTVLDNFLEIKLISYAFMGIKIAVAYLILDVGIKMAFKLDKVFFKYLVVLISFLTLFIINVKSLSISSVLIILFGAVVNLIYEVKKK